jgi:hypothetical protein
MIERGSRASNQSDTNASKQDYIEWHHFVRCQEHPDQGAKQHKQNNPGFTHL